MEKIPDEIPRGEREIKLEGNEWEFPSNIALHELVMDEFERRIYAAGWDKDEVTLLITGFDEALANAIGRGNLGIKDIPEGKNIREVAEELWESGDVKRDRLVHITLKDISPSRIEVVVRDEGEGFDPDEVPDPTSAESIRKTSGRGILIMRAGFDEVRYENGGRTVVLVKGKKG